MNGLMLHCGGHQVDLQNVREVDTPLPAGAHYPIAHASLIDNVQAAMMDHGMQITEQAHAITKGGMAYFGLMSVTPEDADPDSDHGMVVGMRNSHDKTCSAGLALGHRVFVCDNLCFSGEVRLARKHTRNIMTDLPGLIVQAIGMLTSVRMEQEERIGHYKEFSFDSDIDVHDFLIRSVDAGVVSNARMRKVLEEYRKPSHEEFIEGGPTAWRLLNAYTECQKGTNLFQLPRVQRRLQGMLDLETGLVQDNLKGREVPEDAELVLS
jgi:hypothetical protein